MTISYFIRGSRLDFGVTWRKGFGNRILTCGWGCAWCLIGTGLASTEASNIVIDLNHIFDFYRMYSASVLHLFRMSNPIVFSFSAKEMIYDF
jgi:hypothetical protein